MSKSLSDVLQLTRRNAPRLLDMKRYLQQPAMMRSDNTLTSGPSTRQLLDMDASQQLIHQTAAPEFPDTTGQRQPDIADYLGMIKGVLVGNPENVLKSDGQSAFGMFSQNATGPDDKPLSMLPTRVGGAADLAMALPMFGGVGKPFINAVGDLTDMAKPFYSQLMRTLEERAPAVATAEHFLDIARKGGKAEELAYSGLEDYLAQHAGEKLSRADVLKHIETNLPELRERMVTTNHNYPRPNDAKFPKFTRWTLPGGENHRELVVTMPPKELPDLEYGSPATQLPKERANSNIYQVPVGHAYGDPSLDVNRLFHARFNDRTTTDGERALHMEELQSDWHQGARNARNKEIERVAGKNATDEDLTEAAKKVPADFGYAGIKPKIPEGYTMNRAIEDGEDEFGNTYKKGDWIIGTNNNVELSAPGNKTQIEALKHMAAGEPENDEGLIFGERAGGTYTQGVPDAPFKKNWHELGMRRALQEAATSGYDRLTWTTGEQQADRYSLAKVVDRLRYDPQTHVLTGYRGGMSPVITQKVAPDKVPDFIGKEASEKLLATKIKVGPVKYDASGSRIGKSNIYELTGHELKLGGEGMNGFYDHMLPAYVDRYAKKWGVKAEQIGIPNADSGFRKWLSNNHDENMDTVPIHDLKIYYEDYKKLYPDYAKPVKVWSIKITPEMRRDLLEKGQPLFEHVPPIPVLTKKDDNSK